ncbi:MAG: hypothetical protein K5765_04820 [Clostridia bacterium]|nr:hypothetical protein [Clostridia bacterium]
MSLSAYVMFVITMIFSFSFSTLSGKKFGRVVPIANIFLIVILYISGLFTRLDIGVYTFILVSVILLLITIVCCFLGKNKNKYVDSIKQIIRNPLFYFYIGIFIAMTFAFPKDIILNDFDEKTHWALIVKNMFSYDNFGNIGDTTTMFNRYLPGTGVFIYAFNFFNNSVYGGTNYVAFNILSISLLMPILEIFNKKLSLSFFASAIVVFALPILFKTSYYMSLLVDALLGIYLAYIYVSFAIDREKSDWFTLLSITLGCFGVYLTKTAGIVPAIFALVLIVFDIIFLGKEKIKVLFSKKIRIAYLVIPVLAIVFVMISWKIYCNYWNTRADFGAKVPFEEIKEWLFSPNDFQKEINTLFFKRFFIGNFEYEYITYLSIPHILTLGIYMLLGLLIGKRIKNIKYGLIRAALLYLLFFFFAIGILYQYIFAFSYDESYILASYARYSLNVYLGFALILVYDLIRLFMVDLSEKEINAKKWVWAVPATIYLGVLIALSIVAPRFTMLTSNKIKSEFSELVEQTKDLKDTDNVYVVIVSETNDDVFKYLTSRYLITPTRSSGLKFGGTYTDGRDSNNPYTGDPFNLSKDADEIKNHIIEEGYNYIYLFKINDEFKSKYTAMFGSTEIIENQLYSITVNGDNLSIEIVE